MHARPLAVYCNLQASGAGRPRKGTRGNSQRPGRDQAQSQGRIGLPLYKGGPARWLCAVAKEQDDGGLIVTAYPTDAIKAGEQVWAKLK